MTHLTKFIERMESKPVLEHLQQRAKESKASLAAWAARRIAAKAALDAQIGLLDQLMDAVIADALEQKAPDLKLVTPKATAEQEAQAQAKAEKKAKAKEAKEAKAKAKAKESSTAERNATDGSGSGTGDEPPAGTEGDGVGETATPDTEESSNE